MKNIHLQLLSSCSPMVPLARHSSLLAQLTHHNLLSRSERNISTIASCTTSLRLEPELHGAPPNIQRRHCCHSSLYSRTHSFSFYNHQIKCFKEYQTTIVQPLRLLSTTSLLCNCHKSPPELQQMQRVHPTPAPEEKPAESHDVNKSSTQLFQLIRTALSEDTPTEDKDHEHNIHRNIRPAVIGDPEVVTEKLKDLLRGVNKGNRAKLAESITLSELIVRSMYRRTGFNCMV